MLSMVVDPSNDIGSQSYTRVSIHWNDASKIRKNRIDPLRTFFGFEQGTSSSPRNRRDSANEVACIGKGTEKEPTTPLTQQPQHHPV